jgi:hypothetical protein
MRTTTTTKRSTGRRPSERRLTKVPIDDTIQAAIDLLRSQHTTGEHVAYPTLFYVGTEGWTACERQGPLLDGSGRSCAVLLDHRTKQVVIDQRIPACLRLLTFQVAVSGYNKERN